MLQKRIQRLLLTRLEALGEILGEALLDFEAMTDLVTWLERQPQRQRKKPLP